MPPGGPAGGSLTDQVYATLKRRILRREWGPGTLPSESRLARWHGVSKTPAREALRRLHQEGLVELLPYGGYLVGRLTVEQTRDLIEARRVIEGEAADLAAGRAGPKDLAALSALAEERFVAGDGGSFTRFAATNRSFHVGVAEATQNRLLAKVVGDLLDRMQQAMHEDLAASDPGGGHRGPPQPRTCAQRPRRYRGAAGGPCGDRQAAATLGSREFGPGPTGDHQSDSWTRGAGALGTRQAGSP